MKAVEFSILKSIHREGPASRLELWHRQEESVVLWETFKRIMSKLNAEGKIQEQFWGLSQPSGWTLTDKGHETLERLTKEQT